LKKLSNALDDVVVDVTVQLMSIDSHILSEVKQLLEPSPEVLFYIHKFVDRILQVFLGEFGGFFMKQFMNFRILLKIVDKSRLEIVFGFLFVLEL
jgi:hypothetical protein